MDNKHKKFISIQGNIGSGKSTILKIIRQNFPELVILDEPLSSWENVGEERDINLLGMYYDNPKRWGLTFQVYAFFTRLRKWEQYTNLNDRSIKISERSLLSDRYVFASIMRDMEILDQAQYEIYLQCYEGMLNMKKIAEVEGVIYVQCDHKICSQRIKSRAREGQDEIPIDYLEKLHNKHQQWLNLSEKPFFYENQTSKSSRSAIESDFDHHSDSSESQQYDQNKDHQNSLFQIEDPQKSSYSSSNQDYVKNSKKIRSICMSFNPHHISDQKKMYSSTDESLQDENNTKIHTKQKVLVINNGQPLDKTGIIKQIEDWLSIVFSR